MPGRADRTTRLHRAARLLALAVFFGSLLSPASAFAARAFLTAGASEIEAGQTLKIEVYMNTEGEEANAIEGTLSFPDELLELQAANEAGSLISFWIEKPGRGGEGQLRFSGIIPGGITAARGYLFSAAFVAERTGTGDISWQGTRILKNDGKGTEIPLTTSGVRVSVVETAPPPEPRLPAFEDPEPEHPQPEDPVAEKPETAAPESASGTEDIEAPERFVPQVVADQNIFDGDLFLVFATQDKGSGIDHYEVCEGSRRCVVAESPYRLRNQKMDEDVIVKAVDRAGNVREAVIPAVHSLRTKNEASDAVAAAIALASGLLWTLWHRARGKRGSGGNFKK